MAFLSSLASTALFAASSLFVHTATAPAENSATGDQTYHLLQISAPLDELRLKEFGEGTQAIQSCDAARKFGASFPAKVVENQSIKLTQLPDKLRVIIAKLPVGKATPIFGTDGGNMRVLVVCSRTD